MGCGVRVPGVRLRVSGSRFWVSDFVFRVQGLKDSGCMVSGLEFRPYGFGFRVSGFGFRVSGLGFRISGLGFRFSGFVSSALGLAFSIWRSGFRG